MSAPPGFGIAKDRVAILCDMRNAAYDPRDTTLFELVDYIHGFVFPNMDINPANNIAGYEGDPALVRLPFRISNAEAKLPRLMSAKVEVVAMKTGKADFILETKTFDTSTLRMFEGAQDADIEEDKRYIYGTQMAPFTTMSLVRSSTYDSSGFVGYLLSHGFILRYESWLQALQLAESMDVDVAEDIENLTEQWSNFTVSGWSLYFRATFEVKNTVTGFITTFRSKTTITQKALGAEADVAPRLSCSTKYYILDDDDNFVEVNGVQKNDRTFVRYICEGDFTTAPTGTPDSWGYIFADLDGSGGSTNRKFSNTEYPSEDGSPWELPDENEFGDSPSSTYTNGNTRKNVYGTTKVIFDTWYNDETDDWSQRAGSILIFPRIGFWDQRDIRTFADDTAHGWPDGEQAHFAT